MPPHRWVTVRKLKLVDWVAFKQDVQKLALVVSPADTLDVLISQYNDIMAGMIDKHAPTKRKRVRRRPRSPWYSEEIWRTKQERHRLERQRRNSKLHVHREMLPAQCNVVTDLTRKGKHQYYAGRIADCSQDQKKLFQIIHGLMKSKGGDQILPTHNCDRDLSEAFNNFFVTKTENIKNVIDSVSGPVTVDEPVPEEIYISGQLLPNDRGGVDQDFVQNSC